MHKFLTALALTLCGLAHAQMAPAGESLFKALGEQPGLTRLVDDFTARLLADSRTAPHFKETKIAHFKEQLAQQLCQVSQGPCVYKGADMKSAHANLDIGRRDFNALVELLQQAMDAQGIAFSTQNRLLARLAPMHRDVITVK